MHQKLCCVVNSCFEYKDKALPILLESLDKAKVPKECIHIVIGQCATDKDIQIDSISYYYRRWYNVDNNAMLWLTQENPNLEAEWIIYLHDTSVVADFFWDSCQSVLKTYENFECIKLFASFSMGMGFYKTAYLYNNSVKSYMKTLENFDKNRLLQIKNQLHTTEDTLFHFAKAYDYKITSLPNKYNIVDSNCKKYGSDIPRIVEFYEIPGIYKIKANYGQSFQLFVGL